MAGSPGTEDYNPAGNTDSSRRTVALLAGWPTAAAQNRKSEEGYSDTRMEESRGMPLNAAALLTGPVPSGGPAETGSAGESPVDGWATPTALKLTPQSRDNRCLARDVFLAGYPTPRTITGGAESAARKRELGRENSGGGDLQAEVEAFRMPDMTGWKLNPLFSLWLMGFPREWASCGVRAMQSARNSRRSSSKRQREQ
jgi:hypothetical protein